MIIIEGNREALRQWDLNERLVLTDVDLNTEVHFDNENVPEECCPVAPVYKENDVFYADIPNVHLQSPGVLHVYTYVKNADKSFTKQSLDILVIARKKPVNYVYTETELKRWEDMEASIEKIEEDMEEQLNLKADKVDIPPGKPSTGENSVTFSSSSKDFSKVVLPERVYYKPMIEELINVVNTNKRLEILNVVIEEDSVSPMGTADQVYATGVLAIGDVCLFTGYDYENGENIDLGYVQITDFEDGNVAWNDETEGYEGDTLGSISFEIVSELVDKATWGNYSYGVSFTVTRRATKFENLTFTTDSSDTLLEKLYTYQDKWNNRCYTVYEDYAPDIADGTTEDLQGNKLTSKIVEVAEDDEMLKAIKYEALFNEGTYFAIADGDNSLSAGSNTVAAGDDSISVGYLNVTLGDGATAIGRKLLVRGTGASALGITGKVTGRYAMAFNEGGKAIGYASLVFGDHCSAYDYYGAAGGFNSIAKSHTSFAFGHHAEAFARCAMAFGQNTKAGGMYCLVGGNGNKCIGTASLVFGLYNDVAADYNMTVGQENKVSGNLSLVSGYNNNVSGHAGIAAGMDNTLNGRNGSAVFGLKNTVAGNQGTLVVGCGNTVQENSQSVFVAGQNNQVKALGTIAAGNGNNMSGNNGFVVGAGNTVDSGNTITAGSGNTVTSALGTVVSGSGNTVSGADNNVSGYQNTVNGEKNIVGGMSNKVTGSRSLVAGQKNTLNAKRTAIIGLDNKADGADNSLLAGDGNKSTYIKTALLGTYLIAGRESQTVVGQNNEERADALFVVGNGDSIGRRENAMVVTYGGVVECYTIRPSSGVILTSPNGTKFNLTVNNDGTLKTTKI